MPASRPAIRLALSVLPLLVLAGCVSRPLAAVDAKPILTSATAESAGAEATAAEPEFRPFPADTLEALLEAEFAGYRQRADIAFHQYTEQARRTRDPAVLARATTIAQLLGQAESLELAKLWTDIEPESPEAWYLLVLNTLRMQQFETLVPALDQLLALQPDADLEQVFVAASPASPAARAALSDSLRSVEEKHPDNPHLMFARALLQAQAGEREAAMATVKQARQLRPASPQINLLEAKLLTESGRNQEAASLLEAALKRRPESQSLRLNYARSLVRVNNLNGAEREFQTLVQRFPNEASLRLSLALIAIEARHDDIGRRELEQLIDHDEFADEANFYLGQLARRQGNADEAILAYERILPGPQFLQAQLEITRLLVAGKQLPEARRRLAEARAQLPELRLPLYQTEAEILSELKHHSDARQLLTQALAENPGNSQLLLSRALSAEREGRIDLFEADLRDILRTEPDNASALNALGYTLVIHTDRLDEAEAYIRRAHELKPDDPAIIDSMGWVKFKRGDVKGALVDLQRAYALFPDGEVAAHLGEALWVSGQRDEPRRIWTDVLRQHPVNEHILSTRKRLDPQ
ncbi:MAG: tetratricopeptide repeat protein [Moraxellaceae bacterium]|nr:tetratricopeptide repeat protein [Moraxellaceae bacterium]